MTSLSVGNIVYELLSGDTNVMAIAKKVFPVVTDKAELPYVAYRRASLNQVPVKTGHGADSVVIEVHCYAATYSESVELAEAVRAVLDHAQAEKDGLTLRSCTLADAVELWQDDAYVQALSFTLRV